MAEDKTDIKDMNKEQYIAWRAEKHDMDKEEISKLWDKYHKEMSEFGIEVTDEVVKQVFAQRFAKKFGSAQTKEVQFIPIGVQITDFGAKKQYEESMNAITNDDGTYQDDEIIQAAIEEGLIDKDKKPIFHFSNSNNKKNGMVIEPDKEVQYIFTGITKVEEENWTKASLTIPQYQCANMPSINTVYKCNVVIGRDDDNGNKRMYGNGSTEFTKKGELTQKKYEQLVNSFFKEVNFGIQHLEEVAQDYPLPIKSDFEKMVFFQGNVSDINITRAGANNKAMFINPYDEEQLVDTWIPEELEIDFNNLSQNVWVYGNVNFNDKEGMPVVNVHGFFTPEEFRVSEKPEEINPDKTEEKEEKESKPADEEKPEPEEKEKKPAPKKEEQVDDFEEDF